MLQSTRAQPVVELSSKAIPSDRLFLRSVSRRPRVGVRGSVNDQGSEDKPAAADHGHGVEARPTSVKPRRRNRRKQGAQSEGFGSSSWSVENSGDLQAHHRPDLHLVLVHPQIPQNAGSVARTCAAAAVDLHIVEPTGFDLDDNKLKRAGLDYWPYVCVKVHKSWEAFIEFFTQLEGPKRLVAFTVYGSQYYGGPSFQYLPGDWLVYGSETSGLPDEAHVDVLQSGGALVKIPITETFVRSLNVAVTVGVGVFEATRQLDESRQYVVPREDVRGEQLRVLEEGIRMRKVCSWKSTVN